MNIRGISNLFKPETVQKKERSTEQSTPDRDAQSGQQGGDQQQKRQYTSEEIEKIIQNLKKFPGVVQNNLHIRVDSENSTTVVYIEDIQGKVVRRLAGSDLIDLTKDRDEKKGHLLNKAM